MKKNLLIGALSLFVALQATSLWAGESNEHQGHQPVKTEQDHGKNQPASEKTTAGTHRDQMESKMVKMSVRMEKMQQELGQAEEKMNALKGLVEKARQTPSGEERNKLMAEHGTGLRTILAGFRTQMEKMMAQMDQHHMMGKEQKGDKQGMDHGGNNKNHGGDKKGDGSDKKEHGGGGMMNQDMMDEMASHHEMMKKRLALLTDLLVQMDTHLAVLSSSK
ncbi:MAG: hypothetical protein H7839_16450 [Magnetococcus sp. YQC-5]